MAKTYSEKLKNPKWQRRRLDVLSRDSFTCQLCGDIETELQVHHLAYQFSKEPWEYPLTNLVTYCKHCHMAVEHLKKEYPDDVIKCHKRLHVETNIYVLSVLMKIEDKFKVAVISFDIDFCFEVIAILGSETIGHMANLIEQHSNTSKTPEHG